MDSLISRRSCLVWVMTVCGGSVLSASRVAPRDRGQALGSQPLAQFRADVALVPLAVTARDPGGRLVHDLRAEELEVLEDGTPQTVAHFGHHEAPISVAVLFDRSNSMADDKLMHAKDGVLAFARALRAGDEMLLVAFGDTIRALGDFGLDIRTLERGVKQLDVEGGTRLYDAVVEASYVIAQPERKDKRALLILSDGDDTASRAALEQAVGAVKRAGVPVYAIGIELGAAAEAQDDVSRLWRPLGERALAALRKLSDGTGGWTYPVEAARRCREICMKVADELRNQYLIGYYPSNLTRDGQWRQVAVRTTRSAVTLTTRTGYFAPPGEDSP